MSVLQTYSGILIGVTIVVAVGVLATQGLLDGKFADLATGLVIGGGGGIAIGTKITPRESDNV